MKHLVLIPHLPSAQQGHELTLAIAGWRKHFKADFTLAIMGENLPTIEGVVNVESPRVPDVPGEYRPHLDYVSCARKAREQFPDTEGFIVAGDDVFAVNDFTFEDVLLPKVQELWLPTKGADIHPNPWRRNLAKTGLLCAREGLGCLNFTTHLPHHYEWDKLFAIYDKYHCDTNSLVIENVYYNAYSLLPRPHLLHRDDKWKYEVSYTPLYLPDFLKALETKTWIVATENGWSEQLEEELAAHYQISLNP